MGLQGLEGDLVVLLSIKPHVKNKTMSVFGHMVLSSSIHKPREFLPYAKFPIGII